MKAIVMDLRGYDSLTVILGEINERLKKLGPVDCVSCYMAQGADERFVGFVFTYNESKLRRENLIFQMQGVRIYDKEEVEATINEELWKIEDGGMRMRYMKVYWRKDYVLAMLTIGRRA